MPAMAAHIAINCSSTNLLQTYSNTPPSLALNGVPRGNGILIAQNATVYRVCFYTRNTSTTTPPTAGDLNEHCLAPSVAAILDTIDAGQQTVYVYARADAATCVNGYVDLDLY